MCVLLKARLSVLLLTSCLFIVACINTEKPLLINKAVAKKILFSRNKGNCLACHVIAEGKLAGNIGPELKNISHKFKNKKQLRQFIWNASTFNPKTAMPPFGKNKILSAEEIDLIVNYLWKI
ncbi:MAG: sulfur oxidation c-type cytochrome SoxX [Methylococcales bacterium]|nr:sulfur oxidation c-type cytochrome SoxX [Methylococcales bacterium]MCK5925701.1 sulfur oxidation c-type cytochrome SoxX [Methylococcales bacterium]